MSSFDISRPTMDEMSGDLLSHDNVNSLVMPLYSLDIDEKQQRNLQNCAESLGRHIGRRLKLERGAGIGAPIGVVEIPSGEAQHMIYDLYESYYQGTYKTLSVLAALADAFNQVFGNMPTRSMKKFLDSVQNKEESLIGACQVLEKARQYRTLLDHPAGTQAFNWITHNKYDGRGIVVLHYGLSSRTGNIPEGADSVVLGNFPVRADWVFDPPYVLDVDRSILQLARWMVGRLESTRDAM
ncbi:hypothetical protein [Kocuria rosea]|uniref:hypothetical protein n=1 Tax=Kocuria rosea TaxID=1275 RepID=UPI0011B29F12|nr:hypothetical protein [Kocuria rosea]